MLRMAFPSGNNLGRRTEELFTEARIRIVRPGPRVYSIEFDGYEPLVGGMFIHPKRVISAVSDGDFDIGITGSDLLREESLSRGLLTKLVATELVYNRASDAYAEVVLYAHRDDPVRCIQHFPKGSTVLSEYPSLTREFFAKIHTPVVIEASPGSSEAEVPSHYRFGVALKESGESLSANDLVSVQTLMTSSAVFVVNEAALRVKEKAEAIHVLKLLLLGALEARNKVLLLMNVPVANREAVLQRLPALASPTIAVLAREGFVSLSSVVSKKSLNALIPALLQAGAQGIISQPITTVIEQW